MSNVSCQESGRFTSQAGLIFFERPPRRLIKQRQLLTSVAINLRPKAAQETKCKKSAPSGVAWRDGNREVVGVVGRSPADLSQLLPALLLLLQRSALERYQLSYKVPRHGPLRSRVIYHFDIACNYWPPRPQGLLEGVCVGGKRRGETRRSSDEKNYCFEAPSLIFPPATR